MTDTTQLNEKKALLEDILEVDTGSLELSNTLNSLDSWDSLSILAFITMADEHYGVVLAAEDIENAETVETLLHLIK